MRLVWLWPCSLGKMKFTRIWRNQVMLTSILNWTRSKLVKPTVVCYFSKTRKNLNNIKFLSFKWGKTSDIVIFEQITDPIRPFCFSSIITVSVFVFDHANHSRKKLKISWVQCLDFHAQIAYCLKIESQIVLSIWPISWRKSNRSKRDDHWSLTFPVKESNMFHFWMLKSIISYKSETCQTEIQSLNFFFSNFGFDHANHTR